MTASSTPGPVLWEETVPGGCHWSGVVRRGVSVRFTDREGGANCLTLHLVLTKTAYTPLLRLQKQQ